MSEIVVFTPRSELTASENLVGFIDVARNHLGVFGNSLNFDEDTWDITDSINLKARRGAARAIFSAWKSTSNRDWNPMPEPFLSFAKSYFRYQHAMRPTKIYGQRLAALRALCEALEESGNLNLVRINSEILNRTAQLIKQRFTPSVAYRTAGQVEMLSNFLDENRLVSVPLQWRHPISRPSDTARVGKEFDKRREEKLPSAAALDAVARAYRAAENPVDVLITSLCALMCSAPERINEVLLLRADCEHFDVKSDGTSIYGLRFWPSKGADPQIKWLIPTMAGLVQEALKRIRGITDKSRAIARWYEENPTRLYLSDEIRHLRDRVSLTLMEVGAVVFQTEIHRTSVRAWCISNNVPLFKIGRRAFAKFVDVEDALLARLPTDFPVADIETKVKYSELLCIAPINFFHPERAVYQGLIGAISTDDINSRLGWRSAYGVPSVFDKLGLVEDDGSPIRITTHMFRHYLNSLAQSGGMSQIDIAKWSGRKDISQNAAYDHISARDMLALTTETFGGGDRAIGSLATLSNTTLIPRDEYANLKLQTAHTTEFGYCVHDFAMTPCQVHNDCINCNESVCVKGEDVKHANLRRLQEETTQLVSEAERARGDEVFGANRWLVHQKQTLERVNALLEILDNPSVQLGAVIRLTGIKPASRLEQAEARRIEAGLSTFSIPLPLDIPSTKMDEGHR